MKSIWEATLLFFLLSAGTLHLGAVSEVPTFESNSIDRTTIGLLRNYMETLKQAFAEKKAGKLEKAAYLANQVNQGIRSSFKSGRTVNVGLDCPMVIDMAVREIRLICLPEIETNAVNPMSGVAKKIDFAFQFGYATESYPIASSASLTALSIIKRIQLLNKTGSKYTGRLVLVSGKGDLGVGPVGRLFHQEGLHVQSARVYVKIVSIAALPGKK